MILAADENSFALQGPRPGIPAGWADTYWVLVLIFAVVLIGAALAIRALWRRRHTAPPPRQGLLLALARAEQDARAENILALCAALRTYLAAVDPRAGEGLSTDELDRRLREIPVFVPAHRSVTGVLRAADAAKFAGSPLQGELLIAGVRDILGRIEDARRLFRKGTA